VAFGSSGERGSTRSRGSVIVEATAVEDRGRIRPAPSAFFLAISASDSCENGWNPENSVELARAVQPSGVDRSGPKRFCKAVLPI
jgi:hypothetical protein